MLKRRRFILETTSAGLALILSPSVIVTAGRNKLTKLGFISGLIEKELKEDWKGALKKAASFGYTEMETGSYYGNSPGEFLDFCMETGLLPFAGFINFDATEDQLKRDIDLIHQLGMKYAVNYWPWYSGGPFRLDECKRSSDRLNHLGDFCNKNGLIFCWHNHNKEFIEMEKGLPFDYLMDKTDPVNVKCEMDVYWVQKGGGDPLSLLKKYKGRYPILHIKDMASGPDQDFACPGSGIIDFRPLLREAEDQKIEHYIVERDNAVDGLGCLKTSGEYLSRIRF